MNLILRTYIVELKLFGILNYRKLNNLLVFISDSKFSNDLNASIGS
jgi:hypothetical protein